MSYVVRAAVLDDLPGIADVASATDQPVEATAADVRYATHLLMHGRLVVASGDAGVVGYAGVLFVGDVQMLTDLFVLPLAHGQGIGGRLLDAVWGDGTERATFSSGHPHALPLYIRAGMRPLWPLVYVSGDPISLPAPSRLLVIEDATPDEVADAELSLSGIGRHSDYALWAVRPNARTFVVRDGSEVVAAGATGGEGSNQEVSHLRVRRPKYGADVLLTVVTGMTGKVSVAIPGPSEALPLFVDGGWRVADVDHFMATSSDLVDPLVLFPHPGLL